MKCECFVNAHCAFDCPNAKMEEFEDRYDIPASDAGYERIKCKDCNYFDKYCDCEDCYLMGTEDCPKYGGNSHEM